MKNSEVPMMALRRAVQICGGIDSLSDTLSVSTETLELMRIGEEEISLPLFTQIVGLLLEATATRQGKGTPDSNDGGRKDRRQ
ncbi:MAG TPA: hypothetical protein VFJ70_02990 [Burkholderiales bacterium]|nr:hypothetical protein [Burkholderiales bacterium]